MATAIPFAKQAALFCLLAPLLAIGMNVMAAGDADLHKYPVASGIVAVVSGILILAGPVFGIIALFGMRKYGRKGILGRSIAGMAISGVCILAGVGVFMLASRGVLSTPEDLAMAHQMAGTWESRSGEGAADKVIWIIFSGDGTYQFRMSGSAVAQFSGTWSVQHKRCYLIVTQFVAGNRDAIGEKIISPIEQITPEKLVLDDSGGSEVYVRLQGGDAKSLDELEHAYQLEQTGLATYPSWLGSAEVSGGRIILSLHDDRAPFARDFRGMFGMQASIVQVIVDNSTGTGAIVIDPASAELRSGQRVIAKAIPPEEILATAKEDKEKWMHDYSGAISVAAGQKNVNRMLFFPQGSDMSAITAVVVNVNGAQVSVPGRMMSAAELMELYQKGKKLQAGK